MKLYEETAKGNEQIQKKIKLRLKNWDDDRVAMIDHIIMEMALIEMKEFKSIPVKVSINEFIELAKKYLAAFPDKPQPYSFLKRAALASDPDTTTGAAIEVLDYLDSFYILNFH